MRDKNSPTPSQFFRLIVNALKHYAKSPQDRPKWTDEAMVLLTLFTAVAAFASAWYFQKQLQIMQEGSRAVLVLQDDVKVMRDGDSLVLVGTWENIGSTITPLAVQHSAHDYGLKEDEPTEKLFLATRLRRDLTAAIGPKQTRQTPVRAKDFYFVNGNKLNERHYLWAWAVYRDTFSTDLHVTESCRIVTGMIPSQQSNIFDLAYVNCPHHNCMDKACTDFDEITDLARPYLEN